MTNQDELDAITQTRGTCPICAVDELVYQIAGEAVLTAMDEEDRKAVSETVPRFATGGVVQTPKDAPLIVGFGGCVISGYCPTHDGRVIAFRGGNAVDVTDEAIAARLPEEPTNE